MSGFFILGGVGLAILLLSFVADEVLSGLFNGLDSDLLSGTAIGAFLTTLGFTGALCEQFLGSWLATGIGIAAGVGVAVGVHWATRTLIRSENAATVNTADLIGVRGTVITDVPSEGYGQIHVVVGGHILRLSARAAAVHTPGPKVDGRSIYGPSSVGPLRTGSSVTVTAVLSPTAVEVTPLPATQP